MKSILMEKTRRIALVVCMSLLIANLLVVLLSWIISAMGNADIRSLISSEGLRWFLGNYSDIIAKPILAWLLLLAIAYSSFRQSGLSKAIGKRLTGDKLMFKQRVGLRVTIIVLIAIIAIVSVLVLTPHAVLLSPAGTIFPSPFSRSIIPIIAGTITILSFFYGLVSGTINNTKTAFGCLYLEIPQLLPIFIIYILAAQLYACLRFVFF